MLKPILKAKFSALKSAATNWNDDNISIHGAALAYYTIFSVAPLLLVAIAIAGLVFGEKASQGQIFSQIQGLVGDDGAQSIENIVLAASQKPHAGTIATIIGFVTLLIGASGVFQQLQQSLNVIWRVTTKPGKGIWVFLRRRVITFSMVAVIGFILLVALLVGAAIAALGGFLGSRLPGGEALWHVINFFISFAVVTGLFAAVFKILPDVELAWRDVWFGSAVTAFLFSLGRFLIGLYLGHAGIASSYGAAGSLVVVLLWVFYASQILYFGAEFIRAEVTIKRKRLAAKAGSTFLPNQALEAPPVVRDW